MWYFVVFFYVCSMCHAMNSNINCVPIKLEATDIVQALTWPDSPDQDYDSNARKCW